MGITGKYDFVGIKKYGAMGIKTLIASTVWGATLLKIPVIGTLISGSLELFANWLANNGLMVLNVGAIVIEGEWDQKQFDDHMTEAFKKIEISKGKLTPAEMKKIDDEVIKYFRKFANITGNN